MASSSRTEESASTSADVSKASGPFSTATPRLESITQLHAAAVNGEKQILSRLVAACGQGDLDAGDQFGRSPLMYCVLADRLECAELLLKAGSQVNFRDKGGRTVLHWAAHKGNYRLMKLLLSRGADCREKDNEGQTPLHLCTRHKLPKCMSILLRQLLPGEIDTQDNNKRTALHWAASYGNLEHVKMLIKQDSNIGIPDTEGKTPLHWAASSRDPEAVQCVKLILETTPSVINWQDYEGRTALHLAVADGNQSIVDLLTSVEKCNVSALDNVFRTPLHWAAVLGHSRVVGKLLRSNADSTSSDSNGATPLHYAAQNNFDETVNVFLSWKNTDEQDLEGRTAFMWAAGKGGDDVLRVFFHHGVDVQQEDKTGGTALHASALAGYAGTVRLLLQHGAKINATDQAKHTPLFRACEMGHTDVAQALIDNGARVDIVDVEGRSPLHWAALGGHAYICQILIKYGIDPNIRDHSGRSPLHCAAYGGYVNCMSALMEHEADSNCQDKEGMTCLHWACSKGHLDAVKLLVENNAFPNHMEFREDRYTPLDYALMGEYHEVAQYMIEQGALSITGIQDIAATKIQSAFRGYRVRKTFTERKKLLMKHEMLKKEAARKRAEEGKKCEELALKRDGDDAHTGDMSTCAAAESLVLNTERELSDRRSPAVNTPLQPPADAVSQPLNQSQNGQQPGNGNGLENEDPMPVENNDRERKVKHKKHRHKHKHRKKEKDKQKASNPVGFSKDDDDYENRKQRTNCLPSECVGESLPLDSHKAPKDLAEPYLGDPEQKQSQEPGDKPKHYLQEPGDRPQHHRQELEDRPKHHHQDLGDRPKHHLQKPGDRPKHHLQEPGDRLNRHHQEPEDRPKHQEPGDRPKHHHQEPGDMPKHHHQESEDKPKHHHQEPGDMPKHHHQEPGNRPKPHQEPGDKLKHHQEPEDKPKHHHEEPGDRPKHRHHHKHHKHRHQKKNDENIPNEIKSEVADSESCRQMRSGSPGSSSGIQAHQRHSEENRLCERKDVSAVMDYGHAEGGERSGFQIKGEESLRASAGSRHSGKKSGEHTKPKKDKAQNSTESRRPAEKEASLSWKKNKADAAHLSTDRKQKGPTTEEEKVLHGKAAQEQVTKTEKQRKEEFKLKQQAASVIQRAWRRYQTRRHRKGKQQRQGNMLADSGVRDARWLRLQASQAEWEQQIAALTIQLAWRKYFRRKLLRCLHPNRRQLQMWDPEIIALKQQALMVHIYSEQLKVPFWHPTLKPAVRPAWMHFIPSAAAVSFNFALHQYQPYGTWEGMRPHSWCGPNENLTELDALMMPKPAAYPQRAHNLRKA